MVKSLKKLQEERKKKLAEVEAYYAKKELQGQKSKKRLKKAQKKASKKKQAKYNKTLIGRAESRIRKKGLPGRASPSYYKVRQGMGGLAKGLLGVSTTVSSSRSSKKGRTGGRVGRPRGPSGKYYIPGIGPVGVYKYRMWVSKQKAMRRLKGDGYYEEQEPEQEVQYEQQPQQPQQVQQQPQQTVPEQGNILQAPNVFKGELRNIDSSQAMKGYDQVNKPISNPEGDYFTDVDPLTGKHILRRRVRERWTQDHRR